MKTYMKEYRGETDFLRVRNFLKRNYFAFDKPLNWGLERWNWGRYHPMMFTEQKPDDTRANIRFFEDCIRLWEDEKGEILAMVHTESPHEPDSVFFERSPGVDFLLDEMLDYAVEGFLPDKEKTLNLSLYDYDKILIDRASKRGFTKKDNSLGHNSEFVIKKRPDINLKKGFTLSSMAEGGDLSKRCRQMGLGFDHSDSKDWTTPLEYQEVQKAPDYRPELDLFTVNSKGEYASGCIIWFDDYNRVGYFEPVCTCPEFRRMGLGREVMMEGIRRISELGATKAYVGSSQEFYKSIGFELKYPTHEWGLKL